MEESTIGVKEFSNSNAELNNLVALVSLLSLHVY